MSAFLQLMIIIATVICIANVLQYQSIFGKGTSMHQLMLLLKFDILRDTQPAYRSIASPRSLLILCEVSEQPL